MVKETINQRRGHDLVPKYTAQSSKPLFDVNTVEARSWRALVSWKNRIAPSWLTGR